MTAKGITVFTDPHLGLVRSTGTTSKSKKLYQEHLYKVALDIVNGASPVICAGDLFDTCHNTEEVIHQGYKIADACEFVLGGNHDISNRVEDKGSLHLLNELLATVIISPNPAETHFECRQIGDLDFIFIPHCLSQQVFQKTIEELCESCYEMDRDERVLVLHCNVGSGVFGKGGKVEDGGSSLWLTEELQELVLTKFKKVLVGHEHEPRELHQGRIVVLGNTFPVSFGEIGPRFSYVIDPVTTELTKTQIFFPETQYKAFSVQEFLELEGDVVITAQLAEIKGTLLRKDQAAMARALIKAWKNNPGVLAIKNSAVLEKEQSPSKQRQQVNRTLKEYVLEAAEEAGFESELLELGDD